MSDTHLNRREFIGQTGTAALGLALGGAFAPLSAQDAARPIKVGFIGVGGRGTVLLRLALMLEGVEIPAICDIKEASAGRAARLVERRGYKSPELYTRGPEDYKRMIEKGGLDAVICATPREWHTPMMVETMKAGMYAGTEVPAATSVDECWQLVETSEKTGVPCMMLENYCYFQNVMMILNLLDQGLFGDMVHSEVGYQKDERFLQIGPNGEIDDSYGRLRRDTNGNLYPTHAVGPASWSMKVNRGDRFDFIVSVSTRAANLHEYAVRQFGADHPAAKIEFRNGDVNTSIIRTVKGRTITVYYDSQSPRPWDPILRFESTKGVFMGSMDKFYAEGISPDNRIWEDAAPYYEKYAHPLWKKFGGQDIQLGRGVCEYLVVHQFVQAVRRKAETPLNVYDAAAWSSILELSRESVAKGSQPVAFPDFSRGKWETERARIYYLD